MPHDCTDWTKNPPCRKAPYFLLRRGDEYIYTIVPDNLKALQDIARKEFHLGDAADVQFASSCGNLWNNEPARITEAAWGLVSACIGCATVEVVGENVAPPQEQPQPENAPERPPWNPVPAVVDHDMDGERAPTPEHRPQEDEGDDENMGSPRKARYQRRVVSEDEDEQSAPEDRDASTRSQVPVAASPERVIKKERQSEPRPKQESQPVDQPDKPIKQERLDTSSHSPAASQSETLVHVPTESTESNKLVIRVAHRPSQQESKFTTKPTTKVHKVLAGVCKSFGLDLSHATLYLIVSTADEHGEEENLFPCDKNDSIARAGAEHDTESRFLLKITGEPVT